MKTKTYVLILLAVTLFSSYTFAQRGIRIGYVDMEYILENVEEYREATEQLENKAQQWKVEIEQKQNAVDQMKKDLQAERVLLTDELIAEREEEIQILEKQLIEYQQDRFGPQGDLVLQKKRLIQPIQDQVFNEVQKIGANKKYDFIFDKSADVVMLYSENRWDISDLVLRGIARTRKISPPENEADSRNALQESEAEEALEEEALEEEVSEAIKERQQQAEEVQEARAKSADERRAEQLKLREERKKAYEARRNKLLEEREAKRQEKLEEREQMKDSVQ
ncbi:MAG TPA: OmpH family outer membrane protein [Pricia sp.]|nr:OmpH family outer membrane protein [Pricia sp.]